VTGVQTCALPISHFNMLEFILKSTIIAYLQIMTYMTLCK